MGKRRQDFETAWNPLGDADDRARTNLHRIGVRLRIDRLALHHHKGFFKFAARVVVDAGLRPPDGDDRTVLDVVLPYLAAVGAAASSFGRHGWNKVHIVGNIENRHCHEHSPR